MPDYDHPAFSAFEFLHRLSFLWNLCKLYATSSRQLQCRTTGKQSPEPNYDLAVAVDKLGREASAR